MSITIVESPDPARWRDFVRQHPRHSVFHTPEMSEVFRNARGYHPLSLAAVDGTGELLALLTCARIETAPFPFGLTSRSILYAEPICRPSKEANEALASLIREHDRRMARNVLFTEVRALQPAGNEHRALQDCGYVRHDYLNYILDLRPGSDSLWAKVSPACRSNIRRGEKKRVEVRDETSPEGLGALYAILQRTYDRARVPLADKSLFAEALRLLAPSGMLKIFVARMTDQLVGASIVLLYAGLMYEWYWGAERLKSVYAAETITWHRILWAQRHGFNFYDFGGAGWPDKAYGVREFKAKFGGDLVNYGRYRSVYSPWKFSLAERGYEIARRFNLLRLPYKQARETLSAETST